MALLYLQLLLPSSPSTYCLQCQARSCLGGLLLAVPLPEVLFHYTTTQFMPHLCQNLCSSVPFSVSLHLITLFKIVIHYPMPALPIPLPCFILFQPFHSLTNLVKEFVCLLPLLSPLEHIVHTYHFFPPVNPYWLN